MKKVFSAAIIAAALTIAPPAMAQTTDQDSAGLAQQVAFFFDGFITRTRAMFIIE